MSFLTINGIALPVARGTLQTKPKRIGERGEAFDGSPFDATRAIKMVRSFKTTPMTQSDAAMWTAILRGQCVTWGFEADLYSDQGDAPTADGATWSTDSCALSVAGSCEWTVMNAAGKGTLLAREYGGSLSWGLRYSDDQIFGEGLPVGGFGPRLGLYGDPSIIGVLNLSQGAAYVMGMVFFNLNLTNAQVLAMQPWVASIATAAAPAYPRLSLSGDVVSSAVDVVGDVEGVDAVSATIGGTVYHNAEVLSVVLTEA